MGAKWQYLNNT